MSTTQQLPYTTPQVPKTFGSFHWPTIIKGLFLLLMGNVFGTQFIAYRFNNAEALGTPLVQLGPIALYPPWDWTFWFLRYTKSAVPYVKNTVGSAILIVVLTSLAAFLYVILTNFLRSKELFKGGEDLHGSARFQTKTELISNGVLAAETGVYIGGYNDSDYIHYLKHNGPEHLLCVAPSRSGKGVGIVIPTLLGWEGSTIAYDIKGELWKLTSGWRSQELGQTCLKFNPAEADTAHFNPLDMLRFGTVKEVPDARKIAQILLDSGEKLDPVGQYFLDESITLCAALILHLFYEAKIMGYAPPSPGTLLDIATDSDLGLIKVMEKLKTYPHRRVEDPPFPGIRDTSLTTHPVIASAMSTMLIKGDKEFGSVVGSLTRPLYVYSDPAVRDAVSYSDFTIHDLVNKPMSVYLVVNLADRARLKPLIRMFFTGAIHALTEKMDFHEGAAKKNPYQLLFMIDEAPTLGRMTILEEALPLMAGYGLRAYLIAQDFEQILATYGEHQTIVGSCHVRVVYAPNEQSGAKLISEMTGKTTIQQTTVSYSGSRTSSAQNQMSTSISHVERELLTVSEVSELKRPQKINIGKEDEQIVGPGDMLIFIAGQRPIYGVQILFFLDPEFTRRSQLHASSADSTSFYQPHDKPERPRSFRRAGAATEPSSFEQDIQPIETEIIPMPTDGKRPPIDVNTPPAITAPSNVLQFNAQGFSSSREQ
jgi:type IV secretion system protein VirD4